MVERIITKPLIESLIDYQLIIPQHTLAVYWTSADNQKRLLSKLSQSHVFNLSMFCKYHKLLRTKEIVDCQITYILEGCYPSNFKQLCHDYAKNSEIWRMQIITDFGHSSQ